METEGTIAKTDTFYEILQKGIDTHFPTREIKMNISDKPWMSSKTFASNRGLLFMNYKVSPTSKKLPPKTGQIYPVA